MRRWNKGDVIKDDSPTTWKINPKAYKSMYFETSPNTYGLDEDNNLWLMSYTSRDAVAKKDLYWNGEKVAEKGEVIDTKGWTGCIVGSVAHGKESVCDYGAAITAADEELKALLADAREEFGA